MTTESGHQTSRMQNRQKKTGCRTGKKKQVAEQAKNKLQNRQKKQVAEN